MRKRKTAARKRLVVLREESGRMTLLELNRPLPTKIAVPYPDSNGGLGQIVYRRDGKLTVRDLPVYS